MIMNDYPYVTIAEDGRWCSTGQHRPGSLRVLYDALLHLGYNGDVTVYRACMSMAHRMEQCEACVTIPLNLTEPWMAYVIGVELDDTDELTSQVTLTSLCGSCLADTAAMPIALFPVRYHGDPVWQQCLEAISNPEGPHFHAGLAAMADYAQYLFDLQHTTTRIVIQQCLCMAAYEECHITISHELTHLKCENDLLRGGTGPPLDQDWELKVTYHCLSEVEHAWHFIRQQLDVLCELVDEHTHAIIYLEHTNEHQDLKLGERAVVIASLEQQVQVIQLQIPPAPVAPAVEPDTMSDVDEM
jgi:hypothetical protein